MAKKFIFSSCSYLILFKVSKDESSLIERVAKKEGFRTYYADNISELEECIEKIQYPIDYYLYAKNGEIARVLSEENLLRKYGLHYEIISELSDAYLEPLLQSSMKKLMPEGIPNLIQVAANFVFPAVFRNSNGIEFNQVAQAKTDADFAILGSSASTDWVGQCFIYFNFEALKKNIPSFSGLSEPQILDGMRELANQMIGVVNFNIAQVGISAGGTLPIGFDLRNGAQKPRNTIYTQPVRLEAAHGAIQIEFGPLLTGRTQKTHQSLLDKIQFKEPGEVELL